MGINWFPHWRSIESGGGYIKSVTLEDHEQALAEKDREIVKWSELIGSFTRSQHRYLVEMERLKQALAEKDREIQQIREHEFQNGYREGEAVAKVEKTEQYQWLMAQAVRFASTVEDCNWVDGTDEWAAREFLRSPEAQAFLKEHKP